jgi:hypothetical protein
MNVQYGGLDAAQLCVGKPTLVPSLTILLPRLQCSCPAVGTKGAFDAQLVAVLVFGSVTVLPLYSWWAV